MSKLLKIQSQKHKQVLDITELVNEHLESLGATTGLCHIFSKHTTTAISVADLDSGGTDLDYLEAFEKNCAQVKLPSSARPFPYA
jgi:thiamine phosphate synthase YjbQ (UPF0047 family)